ncbi:hypothetical protein QTL95_04545 [Rhizobium sp. S152]|uniref:hypothetical protein n=1 Tax=Rhizobium sp. S152 TaxID=3055038 RepID=UPI0025AA0D3F|nr:hypothetical protein [Rhizobium sp. S152]MDM9625155.1 hypothetical protein [Rhizobium sp. S152]
MTPVFARLRPDVRAPAVAEKLHDLGLELARLGSEDREALEIEHARMCSEGYYNDAHVAIRLFVWYVTESGRFNPECLTQPGTVSRSISKMRQWANADPAQAASVEIEVTALKLFLLQVFERAGAPRHAISAAQDRLLGA